MSSLRYGLHLLFPHFSILDDDFGKMNQFMNDWLVGWLVGSGNSTKKEFNGRRTYWWIEIDLRKKFSSPSGSFVDTTNDWIWTYVKYLHWWTVLFFIANQYWPRTSTVMDSKCIILLKLCACIKNKKRFL